MKLWLLLILILLIGKDCPANSFAGKSLEDALRDIQLSGVNLVFSSDLVRPEFVVSLEPRSDTPAQILKEILHPHGLTIRNGPAKSLLVVRKPVEAIRTPAFNRRIIMKIPNIEPSEESMIVPFVTIYVTAESSAKFLTDLRSEDFVVKEDGREQPIVEFQNLSNREKGTDLVNKWEQPLRVLFLMDSSSSMKRLQDGISRHERTKYAGLNLIERLFPDDAIMLMGFNTENWIISEMSFDHENARISLLEQEVTGGRTSLFDAVMVALKNLQSYPGRRMIVLCSDGEDTSSRTQLNELMLALQSADVPVFAVATEHKSRMLPRSVGTLKALASSTGGKFLIPPDPKDLDSTMDQIVQAIRSQYLIGYRPLNTKTHGWRQVAIQCRKPRVRLHYRKSYLM